MSSIEIKYNLILSFFKALTLSQSIKMDNKLLCPYWTQLNLIGGRNRGIIYFYPGWPARKNSKIHPFSCKTNSFSTWKRQNSFLVQPGWKFSDHILANMGSTEKKMVHPCMFRIQAINNKCSLSNSNSAIFCRRKLKIIKLATEVVSNASAIKIAVVKLGYDSKMADHISNSTFVLKLVMQI